MYTKKGIWVDEDLVKRLKVARKYDGFHRGRTTRELRADGIARADIDRAFHILDNPPLPFSG